MAKRKIKEKYITVSIAMKVNIGVPDYRLGKHTTKAYAQKLARRMLAMAGGELRKVNGGYCIAADFKTAETDGPQTYSMEETISAPAV